MDRTDDELAALYRDVFEEDRRGAAILEDLVRRFTKRPALDGGIDAVLKTYHRSGMRAVLDYVMDRINQASGAPPIPDDDEGQPST